MPDEKEATKLWKEMQVLGRETPPTGQGAEVTNAWLKNYNKEMAKLKAAWQKASGLTGDPHNEKEQSAIKHRNLFKGGMGKMPTADNI